VDKSVARVPLLLAAGRQWHHAEPIGGGLPVSDDFRKPFREQSRREQWLVAAAAVLAIALVLAVLLGSLR
jgi:hypothetical protein